MQRVDVIRGGQRWLVDQRSTNPAMIARVVKAMQTAGRVEIVRHSIPPPPPPPPPLPPASRARGQRCVYFSTVTDFSCQRFAELGPGYTALLSADLNEAGPGGAYYASDAQIELLGSRGGVVEGWCDGDQTPIAHALAFAQERGLAGVSAQFESDEQYDLLVSSHVGLGIGNPSALTRTLADAIARVERGELALIGEVMSPKPDYSARGINIASAAFYVDRDEAQGGYQPLAVFSVMPAWMRRTCSVYAGGRMSSDDWRLYAEWTKP